MSRGAVSNSERIAWREHYPAAVSIEHGLESKRVVFEAWRQEYRAEASSSYGAHRQAAGWYDDHAYDSERGFGPTLEAALADLLREEHRTEQRLLRPQPEGCRLSELGPRDC